MLVYALESLGQNRSDYVPRWDDYDARVRKRLDPVLDELVPETSEAIRDALLEDRQLKLQQRFLDFAVSHITDNFFIQDARRVERPVRRSELECALKNAYQARSSYVHGLLPLIHQLKSRGIAEGEVFEWDNKPYLTFNGLLRIARTVVLDFVRKQPYLEKEVYDWVPELPGRVVMKVAGQYWIWQHEDYSVDRSAEWLSAFLSVWLHTVSSGESVVPDLRPLLAKFESLLGTDSVTQRTQMLTLHVLYNHSMISEFQSPNHETVHRANERLFDECRIESMVLKMLTGSEWPWEAADCVQAYAAYVEQRFSKRGLWLPWPLEVALMACVADKYRDVGEENGFACWIRRATLESAGRADWQDHLQEIRAGGNDVDLNVLFRPNGESAN